MQDLVQLNMNRIQQLNALEAAQRSQGRQGPPGKPSRSPAKTAHAMPLPVSRVVPAQAPDVEGSWVPVAFSSSVGSDMTTLQRAGQPWILFRDASGGAACIEDCCAHRACPLSLVSATTWDC